MKMNKTDTPTYQKIMIPLRLPQEVYTIVVEHVQNCKKENRSYSINQYLTELILNDQKNKKK